MSEADEAWEPFVQTTLRASLHGSDLARAVVAAGIRFVESNCVPQYVDILLPGDVATAYINGKELCELSIDPEFVSSETKGAGSESMASWLSARKNGVQQATSHGLAWDAMISKLDFLGTHHRGFLVVERTSGGEHQLSQLQFEASVCRDLHVAVVTAIQGYAEFLSLLLRPPALPPASAVAAATSPQLALREALNRPCRPLTRHDIVVAIAALPGVDLVMADALLRRFKSMGAIFEAGEEDLAAIPGIRRGQVLPPPQRRA